MDWQCDLYVYGSGPGVVTIHVANCRLKFKEPLPPPVEVPKYPAGAKIPKEVVSRILARTDEVYRLVKNAERVPIGGPSDDKDWFDLPIEDAIPVLKELKKQGYRFPDTVIECLEEELEELKGEKDD